MSLTNLSLSADRVKKFILSSNKIKTKNTIYRMSTETEVVSEGDTFEEIDFDEVEEEIGSTKSSRPDSFISIIADFFGGLNYKLITLLFLIYVFLNSDLFIDKVLSNLEGATDRLHLTSRGTFINGLLLILLYISADVLISGNII